MTLTRSPKRWRSKRPTTRSTWVRVFGARPRTLLRQAVRSALGLAVAGAAIGAVSAVGLTRFLESLLFGVEPTDGATFAYLCDVYVLESVRGQGLGVWLVDTVKQHPALAGLRRFMLATRDAHSLYARYGFTPLKAPERIDYGLVLALIERLIPDPDERRKVLWDTPMRLFGFDESAPGDLPEEHWRT